MCGIGGIISSPGRRAESSVAETFSRLLAHRGPDDRGFLALGADGQVCVSRTAEAAAPESPLFLIHRRLSILDLTEGGWQPMASEDRRYWIIFNGEIYNFVELRGELEALGHRFRSTSDTEVLLAAYSEWGNEAFARLIGMFALALLDTRERRLVLARDFFGIKPLHYCHWAGGLAFASEVKPLLTLPGVGRSVDADALYFYLRHGVTDHREKTLFAEVRQVPPAHLVEIDLDAPSALRFTRYWSLTPTDESAGLPFAEAAARLRELFVESVSMHLRSDVPVGAALSGGVDSSAIVLAMRSIVGDGLDLHAFSYIADDPAINEERWIELAARASNATLHRVRVTSEDLVRDLPRLLEAHDQPFASTSIYAQFRVFELAAQEGIKVMLDGQGADEVLAGYRSFLGARLSSMVRGGQWRRAFRFVNAAAALPGMSRSAVLKLAAGYLTPAGIHAGARMLVGKDLMPAWLNADWFRRHGVRGTTVPALREDGALRSALVTAVGTVLPALLRYEDRNSMRFSIESRVPFLTPKLVTFILSLPEHYLVSDSGESKSVFRAAMRGLVPDAILDRRDKIGFATPEAHWITARENGFSRFVEQGRSVAPLDGNALAREIDQIRSGARPFHNGIWRSVNVAVWADTHGVVFS
jgi:asparagine synthase (glutamine-hydrolysing)